MKFRVIAVRELWEERMFPTPGGNGRSRRSDRLYQSVLEAPKDTNLLPSFISISNILIETVNPLQVGQELSVWDLFSPSTGTI